MSRDPNEEPAPLRSLDYARDDTRDVALLHSRAKAQEKPLIPIPLYIMVQLPNSPQALSVAIHKIPLPSPLLPLLSKTQIHITTAARLATGRGMVLLIYLYGVTMVLISLYTILVLMVIEYL